MHVSKVSEKLLKRYSRRTSFNKLNAALETVKTFGGESQEAKNTQSEEAAQGCRAHQLEAEYFKAQAEAYAQNLRRRVF